MFRKSEEEIRKLKMIFNKIKFQIIKSKNEI